MKTTTAPLTFFTTLVLIAAAAATLLQSCVQHSPGAKISTVVNISVTPPAALPLGL